jgi:hypothetical protein
MSDQQTPPGLQAKLLEYQLCTNDANHLETVIWTTAGILITGSVAGIGYLGATLPERPSLRDMVFRGGVAILFITLIWLWRRIVSKWYSIQQLLYARILELEVDLSFYKERYLAWMTDYVQHGRLPADEHGKSAMIRLRPIAVSVSVRKTVGWLTIILIIVWVAFFALQMIAMLSSRCP